jgi:hypothetical protein
VLARVGKKVLPLHGLTPDQPGIWSTTLSQRPRPPGDRGAFSDYSQSFTEAIKAVFPHARFQADHFHTVKNIGGVPQFT